MTVFFFCIEKTTRWTRGSKKPFGVEVKTPFHYNRIAVCQLQKNREKEICIWVLQIYIVYGIENEIANIILCLHQSIEEKCFITKKRKQLGKY